MIAFLRQCWHYILTTPVVDAIDPPSAEDLAYANQQTQKTATAKPAKRAKKARTRIRVKARPRAERDQIAAVRAACVARDGPCRFFRTIAAGVGGWTLSAAIEAVAALNTCDGPSEWCHMHDKRRSKTRNQAPDVRHTTAHSLMLCRTHHAAYDAHRLVITARSRQGADGPLTFRRVP